VSKLKPTCPRKTDDDDISCAYGVQVRHAAKEWTVGVWTKQRAAVIHEGFSDHVVLYLDCFVASECCTQWTIAKVIVKNKMSRFLWFTVYMVTTSVGYASVASTLLVGHQ